MFSFPRKAFVVLSFVTLACVSAALLLVPAAGAKKKTRITKVDDLPRHTYAIGIKASELLGNDEAYAEFAARVKKDIEKDLDTYEIEDRKTLQGYYQVLQGITFFEGDYKTSQKYLEKGRELEDKEAQKHTIGMVFYAYLAARDVTEDENSDAFRRAFRKALAARVESLPWDVVREVIEQVSGQMQILSENLLVGLVEAQLDPPVEKSGYLSGDQARQIINFHSAIALVLPLQGEIGGVLTAAIADHAVEKSDIWPARSVSFTGNEGYAPVMVGVWDTGVDVEIFKDRCFTNTKEKMDGRDDDGNGYVDDVHGIAYDIDQKKTTGLLLPLGKNESKRAELEGRLKGFMDITAAVDSPEATEIKKAMAGLEKGETKDYLENLTHYSHYAHGTHVAGIALDGNPYARVLPARLSFDYHMIPQPFTKELTARFGKGLKEAVRYFKDHDVRVVNMSWGFSLKEFEQTLEANGIGESAEERGKMAREMFEMARKDMHEAFSGAPEILFVAAAGNSDNDVEFDQFIPSGFKMPNLLIAGAVDQAGEPTSFTSAGKTVEVYSNGFEVDSYVPGGNRMKLSGTSMASPNVVNLAAKLLAMDPTLTPQQVVELIKEGSEDFGKKNPMLVIFPKRSVELLKERMGKKSG
ncbi:MAG: S8 family serine peptidase [Candidatus Krumholzibacteriia bacterium]